MFNWRNKNKQKKVNKPRAAPQAHRHPQYKNAQAPRPPAVSAARPANAIRPRSQTQPRYNPRPQPIIAQQPRKSQPTLNKPPPKQAPPEDDDDDDSDDMFANMDLNAESDEADEAEENPTATRARQMSVEELNKLSEAEQISLALRMSMGTGTKEQTSPNPASSKAASMTPTSPNAARKAQHIAQPPMVMAAQPAVDKANIEWPSIPNNNVMNNMNEVHEANSAFGLDLSGTKEEAVSTPVAEKSAFGLDLGAADEDDEEDDDANNAEEDMFGNMSLSEQPLNNLNNNTMPAMEVREIVSPSTQSIASQMTASPPPSASLGPMDHMHAPLVNKSVLSQLKRAEQQHERSRKRIWSQIRSCIEREQRIKQRENDLNNKLIGENEKKKEAENAKKVALTNADFESAEKSKNVIRRSMKNIQDIEHQLSKIGVDLKKIKADKYAQEQVYMTKSKNYKEKLDVLCEKHEETMTDKIDDEFRRIEKEEKKYKEKLDRTEREIQLDAENIERTKERLEEIEDLIRNDVKPFQDNLDKREQDKSVLMLEIEELSKQLRSKKEELQQVEGDVGELNGEIQKVRKTYGTQTDEIIEEQSRYSKSREQFNLQKNEYLIKLAGLTTDNDDNREVERKFEDELNSLKLRISKINEGFERFEEKEMRANEWRMEEERLLNQQSKLKKKLAEVKYECEKYEKQLKQIEAKCIHHRQTIGTIDSALPILHADKTTAVNNENYLEAGKIHKSIQSKQQQKDNSLHILKELNQKRNAIKNNLSQTQTQIMSKIKQEAADVRMKIDKQRFELIMDHTNNIKLTLNDLNDMNMNNEDDVEHIVLNLELNQLQDELMFFNEKYGWNADQYQQHHNQSTESQSISPSSSSPPLIMNNIEEDITVADNSKNNEEEELVVSEIVEEKKDKQRTKEEIVTELQNVQKEIDAKTEKQEEIQSVINKAVANDDFEAAGLLAPSKKKLIAEINELNIRLNVLQKEEEECIANEKEEEEVIEDDDAMNPSDEIAANADDNKKGSNGVLTKTEQEEDDDEDNPQEEQLANNIITNEEEDKKVDVVNNDDDNSNNINSKPSSDDEREDNGGDHISDKEEDGNNMFGDLAVADNDDAAEAEADTVNID